MYIGLSMLMHRFEVYCREEGAFGGIRARSIQGFRFWGYIRG